MVSLIAVAGDPKKIRCPVRTEPLQSPNSTEKLFLQSFEVLGARAFVGLHDVELYLLALFEVGAADVFHVEEDVLVGFVGLDEAIPARVVEEVDLSFRHCYSRSRFSARGPLSACTMSNSTSWPSSKSGPPTSSMWKKTSSSESSESMKPYPPVSLKKSTCPSAIVTAAPGSPPAVPYQPARCRTLPLGPLPSPVRRRLPCGRRRPRRSLRSR